jgi:hypothetical protein
VEEDFHGIIFKNRRSRGTIAGTGRKSRTISGGFIHAGTGGENRIAGQNQEKKPGRGFSQHRKSQVTGTIPGETVPAM